MDNGDEASKSTHPESRELPSPPSYAVETRGLTRRFRDIVAVDHLNLSLAPGVVFGLLGPNGAGKSTLIKMLTTLLPPSGGTAFVGGYEIQRQPKSVRRTIGYVSQMLSADGDLTGYENLLISAKLYGIPRAQRLIRIPRALAFMELDGVANKRVKHYSGGMIRRLEIAQSMLHRPAVLFLDEPTVGLDPAAKQAVWRRIRDLRQEMGTTILMTTHDMEEADRLCDRLALMHHGSLVIEGTPQELKARLGPAASLADVFLHYTGSSLAEEGAFRDVVQSRLTARRLG
ncbi:MAG TPA: ATP-binding cassette domain-containing protein [Patescibacteria group bacterium]|nr:ATP-binding cassette domain-containing protein [Patescibacteria group bacterium]